MPTECNVELQTRSSDYLEGHSDGMRLQARHFDACFELRNGEALQFIPNINAGTPDGAYVVGLFPIPTPGPMNLSSDSHQPSEGVALVVARKIADRFTWVKVGAGTHRKITEDLVATGMQHGEWHEMRIIDTRPLESAVPSHHLRP